MRKNFEDSDNFRVARSTFTAGGTQNLQRLAEVIRPDQRGIILSRLFGNDNARFESFVAAVEAAPSWGEAYRLIQAHLADHGVSPYVEEARLLSDLIYKRYFPMDEAIQPGLID